jgi:glyoxalase superfamily protein
VSDDGVGAIGWIREIVLDSPDPWALARFWVELLGGTPVEWYPGWITLEPPPNGQRLSFQGVSGQATAGRHDGTTESAGVHFDILVSSLDTAHGRVIAAGGAFVSEHVSPRRGPDGEMISWRVYRDPEGHLFCLVVR